MKLYQEDIDTAALKVFDALAGYGFIDESQEFAFELILEALNNSLDTLNNGYRNYN